MVYIIIIDLFLKNGKDEILTEVYSNRQEAKLTYDIIIQTLNEGKYCEFDNKVINTIDVKSVRLVGKEVICQR